MSHRYYIEAATNHKQEHDRARQRLVLSAGRIFIGRSPHSCSLVLPDPRVSRVHLQVIVEPDVGITIKDLHSANGTTFDGRTLFPGTSINWLLGQVVSMGDTELVLRYGELDE